MEPHLFYDRIAARYDRWANGRRGREVRRRAADELALRAGDIVLVVGCGTGLDLPPLVPAVGRTGRVLGLDRSGAMLARARCLVERSGWTNVTLIHEDARALGAVTLHEHAGIAEVDALLFSNLLTIVPDWAAVFEGGFSLLRRGGRCVILDVKLAAGAARILNPILIAFWKLGRADVRRPIAGLLDGRVDSLRVSATRTHVVVAGVKR